MPDIIRSKELSTCSHLMKTVLNNVVLSNLFTPINNIEQHYWAWIECKNAQKYCFNNYKQSQ